MSETTQEGLSKLAKLAALAEQPSEIELRALERKAARAKAALAASACVEQVTVTPVTEDAPKGAILDQGLPYSLVGGGGIIYEQGGKLFNQLGYEVDASGKMIDTSIIINGDEPRVGQHIPVVTDKDGIVSYHRMNAGQLRAVLESYGEEYTTRENAIALLEGLNAA